MRSDRASSNRICFSGGSEIQADTSFRGGLGFALTMAEDSHGAARGDLPMDMEFTETQQMIRQTLRDYMTREIEPLVADMEAERLLPYGPLRKMVADLGLGRGGELAAMMAESPPEENLKLFVPRVLSIEMSRVCAGFALSHGASLGLTLGNIRSKGTEEQKKRWG